jgi:hypothetical protein
LSHIEVTRALIQRQFSTLSPAQALLFMAFSHSPPSRQSGSLWRFAPAEGPVVFIGCDNNTVNEV